MALNDKKPPVPVNKIKTQQNDENAIPSMEIDLNNFSYSLDDINRQYEELRKEQRRTHDAILKNESDVINEENADNELDGNNVAISEAVEVEAQLLREPIETNNTRISQAKLDVPKINLSCNNQNLPKQKKVKNVSPLLIGGTSQVNEIQPQVRTKSSLPKDANHISPRSVAVSSQINEIQTPQGPQVKTKLYMTQPRKSVITNQNTNENFSTPQRPVPVVESQSQPPLQGQARVLCTIDMKSHMNAFNCKSQSVTKVKPSKSHGILSNVNKKPAVRTIVEETGSIVKDGGFKPLKKHLIEEVFKVIVVNNVEYLVLSVLGKGGSSIVYNCYDPRTKGECAIKYVNLNQDRNEVMGFINEVDMLKRLQGCDRIIKLHQYQILENERKLFVVLEKGGRDFSEILREHAKKQCNLQPFMIIYYWMQMLYAVQQIHSLGVIHSDLKPANFLETQEHLKLIDFGISSCVQVDMTSVVKSVALGTFGYISPEALCQDHSTAASPIVDKPKAPKYKISFKSDVWSLGCILYQLIYKRTPFDHITHSYAKLATIMDPNHQIDYPRADWVPPRVLDCVKTCLRYDARSRPSINDLIQHYQDFVNRF